MIEIVDVAVGPNACPLSSRICIDIKYVSKVEMEGVTFVAKYIPDIVEKKNQVTIGTMSVEKIEKGENRARIETDKFEVSGLENYELNNVGKISLLVQFKSSDKTCQNLLDIVVHVTKRDKDEFIRNIFNPFE